MAAGQAQSRGHEGPAVRVLVKLKGLGTDVGTSSPRERQILHILSGMHNLMSRNSMLDLTQSLNEFRDVAGRRLGAAAGHKLREDVLARVRGVPVAGPVPYASRHDGCRI